MNSFIKNKFSFEETPQTGKEWNDLNEEDRKKLVFNTISANPLYNTFEITKAEPNGNVIFKIETVIKASERGTLLLDLEQLLKNEIDQGITIWLEPVGDKSKLRNLRGIEIKS